MKPPYARNCDGVPAGRVPAVLSLDRMEAMAAAGAV